MNGTERPRVLVTGATGYIASRLIPRLIEAEWTVRATSRHPEDVGKRHPEVEAIASDLQDESSLERVMEDIDVAYYLVHSMDSKGFADKDKRAAHNFADAAAAAGVKRVVYLGGLGTQNDKLSQHLRSRHEVGRILAEGSVEVLEFRAAIVIGSGSVAFEMLTPVRSSISQPLIEGLRNEVVVRDDAATRIWPEIQPAGYKEAVEQALRSQIDFLDSPTDPELKAPPGSLDGLLVDMQRARSRAEENRLREEIARIGGNARWYPLRWTWWIRARLDDAVGGTGLRWERPDGPLEPGQRVDWWTVDVAGPDRLLLKAEMKVPGEAWLEFRVVDTDQGSELRQTAYFRPRGLFGRLYWWALWPFHISIFKLMAKRLARRSGGEM